MGVCTECAADVPDGVSVCPECGADLDPDGRGSRPATGDGGDADGPTGRSATDADPGRDGFASRPGMGADFDPEAEREWFENRYGIDVGDRTVDEFLAHLDRQDYSPTPWFWLAAITEVAGVVAFALVALVDVGLGVNAPLLFGAFSLVLAVSILGDTRAVGQFRRWAKIRWTYVLMAAVPLVGHIAALFYLLLRRLMHEQTVEYRRRLLDAGFDIDPGVSDD